MAKTILIVEDDPNISELVQMYLEKEGYNTASPPTADRDLICSGSSGPIWCCSISCCP